MKVSELLKKIGSIGGAEIHIVFKADKAVQDPDVVTMNGDTPEETADQIIERAAEYSLQEISIAYNDVQITAVKAAKRPPKPKTDKVSEERREEQKQAIRDEMERLKQAVAELVVAVAEPFRQVREKDRRRAGALLGNIRAAVRRILTRIFRKGAAGK